MGIDQSTFKRTVNLMINNCCFEGPHYLFSPIRKERPSLIAILRNERGTEGVL